MAVDKLVRLLSTAFRKDPDSNNYKLLKVVDSEFSNIEQVVNDIKNAHLVDFATGKSLDYIASLFNVRRKQNETDDHFRARIKLAFSKISNMATINDIKEIIAVALNTKTSRVRVRDRYDLEVALFEVWIWLQDLNNAGLTLEEFQELIKAVKPAGVQVKAYQQGTFTYRSIEETSDPTKGYNDLANSNPDAGTYAGLL
ncbi:hypothetical protein [Archaeoglobus profundus]|uniref:Uncharacterized protein n=1 Tax=Archaeoglobus profundus (strain DSM 5631 / JCM 9629 / NBRC 100127 / Av18) TaxID=572546 RepID=D2REI2_ARCPA|nr:hypothetical protein [Archaeoglobus profundus]ADB58526.1 hypothetical protein Arcpr_1479 [Archaeoglobus profundus DSM 5631]